MGRPLFNYIFENSTKFEDGRVNYRSSRINLVLAGVIVQDEKILLLKRSHKVLTYWGLWDFIGGYLDDWKLPEEKIMEEMEEELAILPWDVLSIRRFRRVIQYDDIINKVRVNFPMMVIVKSWVVIKLDEEHTDYKRITHEDLANYDLVPWTKDLFDYILTFTSFY